MIYIVYHQILEIKLLCNKFGSDHLTSTHACLVEYWHIFGYQSILMIQYDKLLAPADQYSPQS